jgi:superfamily I DNA/RNA helicase
VRLKLVGPPGSGKTFTLLQLFEAELKRGTKPDRIAFLTFTRSAREEALSRANRPVEELPFLKTIHAVCYRQLGATQNQLVKPKDIVTFGKRLGLDLSGRAPAPWEEADWESFVPGKHDKLLQLNHLGRHRRVSLREALRDADPELEFMYCKWFTQAYRAWKEQENLLDYTDLLTEYLEFGQPLPVDAMFVDEAQDLSSLQWDVVHKLGANADRWYLVGDPDQAIFEWAGASAKKFVDEPADETRVLGQSYRLPEAVWELSEVVAKRIKVRLEKPYKPRDCKGLVRRVGSISELTEHLQSSALVLYRNAYRGRAMGEQLSQLGVPYAGYGSVLSRPDVNACLQAFVKAPDGAPLTKFEAQSFIRYCSKKMLHPEAEKRTETPQVRTADLVIFEEAKGKDLWDVLVRLPNVDYVDRCYRGNHSLQELLEPKVRLQSIHSAKGREADTVLVDPCLARRTWEESLRDPDPEHRVWYVAVTRARENLLLLVPQETRYYPL